MIRLKGSVLFHVGSNALTDEARKTLDAVANVIKKDYPEKDILIIGHTDDQPIEKSGWDDNYQLSAERSLGVVRYLISRGISPKKLVVAGAGEYRERAPNSSDANREKNRRVELFAIELKALAGS
jgi:chemotaxis protein MotB